ncbi:MAG: hypothetical protein ABIK92_18110 [Pseudomonadota bacterium]
MTKNKIIWLISIVLILNGIYQIYANLNMLWISNGTHLILNFLCAFGLLFEKSWSQHYVYVLSFFSIGGWFDGVINVYRNGWPYSTIEESIISLIPGLCLIAGWFLLSVYTVRLKRMKRDRQIMLDTPIACAKEA